jgi:pimeloyl-ACP methyl ester carboxylesterase
MKGTYQSGGATLSYRESGTGLPIVFLHPTPLDGEFWRPLTEEIAGVRAILPDLRGHGSSELGSLPLGGFSLLPDAPVLAISQLAADTLALLDHLKVSAALFAGCSIGGYVLLELWRQAPERVRGLLSAPSRSPTLRLISPGAPPPSAWRAPAAARRSLTAWPKPSSARRLVSAARRLSPNCART